MVAQSSVVSVWTRVPDALWRSVRVSAAGSTRERRRWCPDSWAATGPSSWTCSVGAGWPPIGFAHRVDVGRVDQSQNAVVVDCPGALDLQSGTDSAARLIR